MEGTQDRSTRSLMEDEPSTLHSSENSVAEAYYQPNKSRQTYLQAPYVTGDVLKWRNKPHIRNTRESGHMLEREHWVEALEVARGENIVQFATGFGNSLALTDTGEILDLNDKLSESKEDEDPVTTQTTWLSKHIRTDESLGTDVEPTGSELAEYAKASGMRFSNIAIGKGFAAGVNLENQKLYTWGVGVQGQLGVGHCRGAAGPTRVRMNEEIDVAQVVCGEAHMALLSTQGQVFTTGRGFEGQLGQSVSNEVNLQKMPQMSVRLAPKYVQGLLSVRITKIGCGNRFTVALSDLGTVWTWGEGTMGQLGDGRCTKRSKPLMVIGPPNLMNRQDQEKFDLQEYNKAILEKRSRGELGSLLLDQQTPKSQQEPNAVASSWNVLLEDRSQEEICEADENLSATERPVVDFACGIGHVVVINEVGQVISWGFNLYGQLGLGDTKTRFSPTLVEFEGDAPDIVNICAGDYSTVVVDATGCTWQWGARLTVAPPTPTEDPESVGLMSLSETEEVKPGRSHAIMAPEVVKALEGKVTTQLAITQRDLITVHPAVVTSLEPATGGVDGGTTLRVFGTGFWADERIQVKFTPIVDYSSESMLDSDEEGLNGQTEDFDELDDSGSSVGESSDGDEDTRDVTMVPGYYDEGINAIVCSTPMFSKPGLVEVEVSVDGEHFTSDAKRFVFFELPEVQSVSPTWVCYGTETTVVLEGTGFAPNDDLQVRLRTVEPIAEPASIGSFHNRSISGLAKPSVMTVQGQHYKILDEKFLPAVYCSNEVPPGTPEVEEEGSPLGSTKHPPPLVARKTTHGAITQSTFGASTRSMQSMASVASLAKSATARNSMARNSMEARIGPQVMFTIPSDMDFPASVMDGSLDSSGSLSVASELSSSLTSSSKESTGKYQPKTIVQIPHHRKPLRIMIDLAMNGVDFTSCGKSITLSDLAITDFEPKCAPVSIPVGEVREVFLYGTGIVDPPTSHSLQVRFLLTKNTKDGKPKAILVKAKRKKLATNRYQGLLDAGERFMVSCQVPKIGNNALSLGKGAGGGNKVDAILQVSLDSGVSWVSADTSFSFYQVEVHSVAPQCGPYLGGNTVRLRVAHPDDSSGGGKYLTASDLQRFFGDCAVKVKVIAEGTKKISASTTTVEGEISGVAIAFQMPKMEQFTPPPPKQKPKPQEGSEEAGDAAAAEDDAKVPILKGSALGLIKFRVALNGSDFSNASPKYTLYANPTVVGVSPELVEFPFPEGFEQGVEGAPSVESLLEPIQSKFTITCSGLYNTGALLVQVKEVQLSEEGVPLLGDSRPNSASSSSTLSKPINFTTTPGFNSGTGELTFDGPMVSKNCALMMTISMNGVNFLVNDPPVIVQYKVAEPPPSKPGKKGRK